VRVETQLGCASIVIRSESYLRSELEDSRVWEISANEHLSAALDRITCALFACVLLKYHDVMDGYGAAVKQHQQILDALATKNPAEASRTFKEVTVGYWRNYCHLRVEAANSGQANGAGSRASKRRAVRVR